MTSFKNKLFSAMYFLACFCHSPAYYNIEDVGPVYVGEEVKIIVPVCPLSQDSLAVATTDKKKMFTDWTQAEDKESYELLNKIIQIWQEQQIASQYLVIGKQCLDHDHPPFSWEIIPFSEKEWHINKQLRVIWNVAFGASFRSYLDRYYRVKELQQDYEHFAAPFTKGEAYEVAQGNDPFCNDEVLRKQTVFEGEKVRVLYNYAPITAGEEKLHFLIIPKAHREKFSELTQEEYQEAACLMRALLKHYQEKGFPIAYLYHKSGKDAGQTVFHWHTHVVFCASQTEEYLSYLKIIQGWTIGGLKLSQEELAQRVANLKHELTSLLLNDS